MWMIDRISILLGVGVLLGVKLIKMYRRKILSIVGFYTLTESSSLRTKAVKFIVSTLKILLTTLTFTQVMKVCRHSQAQTDR